MKKQEEINIELNKLKDAIIEYGDIRDNIRELKEYVAYNVGCEKEEYYDVCNLAERQAYNDVMDVFGRVVSGIGINELQNRFTLFNWIKEHEDQVYEEKTDDGWIEVKWIDDNSVLYVMEDYEKKKD